MKYFCWLLAGLSAGPQLLHNYNTMHLFPETGEMDVKHCRQQYVCIRVASVPSLCMSEPDSIVWGSSNPVDIIPLTIVWTIIQLGLLQQKVFDYDVLELFVI